MANKLVNALNTVSGVVGPVNESALRHATFGKVLVEVPTGTKSFAPDKWKPLTAEEFLESRKALTKSKEPEEATEAPKKTGEN